jgi:single-strand DNA-binding protein
MPAFNKVIIAGNLTRDPQVRFLSNEKAVAEFGLAINRKIKTADGQVKDETVFVDCEAWGRTAELVGQYLTKGRAALIEGRLKFDSWEDKASGQKRSKLKVVADTVQFLGDKPEQGADRYQDQTEPTRPAPTRPSPSPASPDDEAPF